MSSKKVALSLAGGGSRGILQYAFLKCFKDYNLHYDMLFTASVGALNGILFYQNEMEKLEDLWLSIKNPDVYKRNFNIFSLFTKNASIYDSKPLEELIRKYLNINLINNGEKPFIVAKSDLVSQKPIYTDIRKLNFEDTVMTIKASASPPILFPPIIRNNEMGVDAGIISNYQIIEAIRAGCDTVILFTPTNYKNPGTNNILDIIEDTISTSSMGYLQREIEAAKLIPNIKLIVVRPDQSWDQGLINFNYKEDRKALIDFGYQVAAEKLKDILS